MSLQHIWSERTCSAIISLPFIIISGFIPGPGTSASLRSWLFKIEATVRQGNILQFFYVQHKGQQTGRQWKVVWVKVKELSTAEWRSLPTSLLHQHRRDQFVEMHSIYCKLVSLSSILTLTWLVSRDREIFFNTYIHDHLLGQQSVKNVPRKNSTYLSSSQLL